MDDGGDHRLRHPLRPDALPGGDAYRTVWYVVHGALVFRRADERRAASDPGRRPFFPSLVTPADAAELPRLAALSEQWEEITGGYDVAAQLAAVVDGLLAHR